MKKITIVGAGNIGIACAVDLALNNNNTVTIFSHKASNLGKTFTKVDHMLNHKAVTSCIKDDPT